MRNSVDARDFRHVLIGRDDVIDPIVAPAGTTAPRGFLVGPTGAGKTTVLHMLLRLIEPNREAQSAEQRRAVLVDFSVYDPGHPGHSASVGAVQASFVQFSTLLGDLLRATAPQSAVEEFEQAVDDC